MLRAAPPPCSWKVGDVIGLAANVDAGMLAVSKNGSWSDAGCGVVLEGEACKVGVYPAFSMTWGEVRHYLAAPFKHGPPPASVWLKGKAHPDLHSLLRSVSMKQTPCQADAM